MDVLRVSLIVGLFAFDSFWTPARRILDRRGIYVLQIGLEMLHE